MITLIIYLIGYVLAYILLRLEFGFSYDWYDVFDRAKYSLFSWILVMLLLLMRLVAWLIKITDKYFPNDFPKPPKFL